MISNHTAQWAAVISALKRRGAPKLVLKQYELAEEEMLGVIQGGTLETYRDQCVYVGDDDLVCSDDPPKACSK